MVDWYCTTCKFIIFGSKKSCKKCGEKKPADLVPKIHIKSTQEIARDAELETFRAEFDVAQQKRQELLKQKALDEGLPILYYTTDCSECKKHDSKLGHNCWKYR